MSFGHAGVDRHGACDVTHHCTRDERLGSTGRASYLATKGSTSEEVQRYTRLLSNETWDAVVLQCPFWHFLEASAYDAQLSPQARRAAIVQRTAALRGKLGYGGACVTYARLARKLQPAARLYLLGHYAQPVLTQHFGEVCRHCVKSDTSDRHIHLT